MSFPPEIRPTPSRFRNPIGKYKVHRGPSCVHCGLCTNQCHYVLANPGDVSYAPPNKAAKLRKLFKAHIDWTGRVAPWWVGAKSVFTDEELDFIVNYDIKYRMGQGTGEDEAE